MRTILRPVVLLLAIAVILPLGGCTESSGRIAIEGKVTYKGAPLAKGVVTFIPADTAKGTSEGALIADGKYAIPADKGLLPGSYHVSISSVQAKGSVDPGAVPGAPKGARELLPAQYNTKSRLTIEVTSGGKREIDFPLD